MDVLETLDGLLRIRNLDRARAVRWLGAPTITFRLRDGIRAPERVRAFLAVRVGHRDEVTAKSYGTTLGARIKR